MHARTRPLVSPVLLVSPSLHRTPAEHPRLAHWRRAAERGGRNKEQRVGANEINGGVEKVGVRKDAETGTHTSLHVRACVHMKQKVQWVCDGAAPTTKREGQSLELGTKLPVRVERSYGMCGGMGCDVGLGLPFELLVSYGMCGGMGCDVGLGLPFELSYGMRGGFGVTM